MSKKLDDTDYFFVPGKGAVRNKEIVSDDLLKRARGYKGFDKKNVKHSLRELCKGDLKFLCKEMLRFKDWDEIHDEIASFLDKDDGRAKLLMIPRKHLKSSMVTVGRSIQLLLRNPNIRILIANAVWNNARNFLHQIKRFLEDMSELPKLFGEFKGGRWTSDDIEIDQRTEPLPAPTISTTGVGGTQTSQHYDLIVLDDLVARENIGTPEQRLKVKDFYKDCLNLVEEEKQIFILGTTWHEDDLYNDLRKRPDFDIFVRKAYDEEGNVLFPKKFTMKKLMHLRDSLGPYLFSSQYLLNPYPEEKQQFKESWFNYYYMAPQVPMYITTVLDPSLGKEKSNDCGITTTGVTADGKIYILEARRFKKSVDLIPRECAKDVKRWKSNVFALEAFAMQQLLEKPIKKYFDSAGISTFVDLLPRWTREDKATRILALVPSFHAGRMWMRKEMRDLQEELLRFDPQIKSNRDDIIDSLSWHIRYWDRKPKHQVQQKEKEFSLNWWLRQGMPQEKDIFDDMRQTA